MNKFNMLNPFNISTTSTENTFIAWPFTHLCGIGISLAVAIATAEPYLAFVFAEAVQILILGNKFNFSQRLQAWAVCMRVILSIGLFLAYMPESVVFALPGSQ